MSYNTRWHRAISARNAQTITNFSHSRHNLSTAISARTIKRNAKGRPGLSPVIDLKSCLTQIT